MIKQESIEKVSSSGQLNSLIITFLYLGIQYITNKKISQMENLSNVDNYILTRVNDFFHS